MAAAPVAGSAPAKLEKKPVKFSNLLCEQSWTVHCELSDTSLLQWVLG